MRDNDDAVPASKEALANRPNMHLDTTQSRVKEVADHADAVPVGRFHNSQHEADEPTRCMTLNPLKATSCHNEGVFHCDRGPSVGEFVSCTVRYHRFTLRRYVRFLQAM